jgi:ribosomal protein S18 acetylase RimI-like enzyme
LDFAFLAIMNIRTSLKPGDLGTIIHLHGTLYEREYGLDYTFEGYVARGMGEFAIAYDPAKDFLAVAEDDGRIVGSVAIAHQADNGAQLRWFLVDPESRGVGIGRRLLEDAVKFCHEKGFKKVILWTISELKPAIHLYRSLGFQLTEQHKHEIWGAEHTEEKYELLLK